ncbi:hypothetical protein [Jatrophihabitans sp.]|uniref:hypothetical protein n=1 Tax=Jatrophihabitans sp. TaxID=1932789 RepID=UPI0030C741E4
MPNAPKTPKHGVRVSDDIWQAALRRAHGNGETLTAVIVRFLVRYGRGDED